VHTPLLIGLLVSFALATAGSTLFYLRAWAQQREQREYLYFGLLSLCVAAHFSVLAAGYAITIGVEVISLATFALALTVPSRIALAFWLHFSLRYAGVKRERSIMASVYFLTAAFIWLGLSGGWWVTEPTFNLDTVAGFSVYQFAVQPTPTARLFYVCVPIVALTSLVLIMRAWLRGGRGGLGALAGAAVMLLVLIHDLVGLVFGMFTTVPLLPLGFLVFGFGVSLTLVSRYARASEDIVRHSEELHQRSLELDASYRELQRTHEQLVRSEQLAVVGELAAVIAHEVRNPLAIVNNAVASLRKRHTTAHDRRTLLEIINEEMARLDKLVRRLLNYARPMALKQEAISLRETIMRALALIEDRPGITAELSLEGGIGEVVGDGALLRQAFENVITNAVQAMDGEGTLRVVVSRHRIGGVPSVAIDFRDDGEGMSEEESEQALSPFFTTRPTGTGLGLPIVGRIIEAHGGALLIDSWPHVGTTVRIALPEQSGHRLVVPDDGRPRISLLP
jgi:signal transduction histidine kinase